MSWGISNLLASAARAVSSSPVVSGPYPVAGKTGCVAFISVTAKAAGATSLTITVESSLDYSVSPPVAGTWATISAMPAITATGTYVIPIPDAAWIRIRQVIAGGAGTDTFTYAINMASAGLGQASSPAALILETPSGSLYPAQGTAAGAIKTDSAADIAALLAALGGGSAVAATGTLSLAGVPSDGDTMTMDDGVNTVTVFEWDIGVRPTGTVTATGNPADGNTVRIRDGAGGDQTFEFDIGVKATGTVTLTAQPADANTVTISDGTNPASVFEFDTGVKATGTVTIAAGNVSDGNTVTVNDGVNPAKTFEFDTGVAATGTVTHTANPADGNTVTISDGVTAYTFEYDTGKAASGTASLSANPADADTITLDDGTNPASVFEFDTGVAATGTVEFTANPADGNTIRLQDGAGGDETFEMDVGAQATGTVTLVANPGDGYWVEINDGATAYRFEFDDDAIVQPGNIAVTIGANKEATTVNLIAAINGTAIAITAAPSVPADNITNLTHDTYGVVGNVAITDFDNGTGNITETGMSGGLDPGDDIVPGNIGVAIGATKEASMVNFIAAVNAVGAALDITASPSVPPDAECALANDAVGTAGNIAIVKVGANITVTGMAGGLDPGTDIVPGNVGVAIGATKEATMANFVAAVNGVGAGLEITATASAPPDHACTLANDSVGVAGNVAIVKSGANITVTGMSGGLDPGSDVTPGNTGVAIGATKEDTCANLITAINGTAIGVTATASVPADEIANLANDIPGTAGNVAITKVGANLTVAGMSGGINPGDDVAPGNVGVAVGATNLVSVANFISAVNGVGAALAVTATASAPPDNTANLQNDVAGVAGNQALAKVGANITVVGMAGGLDPGTDIVPGNVGVAIGATKEATTANLVSAVNGVIGGLTVTATASAPPDNVCNLQNDDYGVIGNVAITKVGANITVAGMSGGLDAGSGPVTPGNVAVAIGGTKEDSIANLIVAINGIGAALKVTAAASAPPDHIANLTNDLYDDAGNIALVKSGANLTVSGMSGGIDPGSAITPGRTGIPIYAGDTATIVMAATVVAINGVGASLKITATATTPASAACTLANDTAGALGNIPIVKSCANLTVTGMSNGEDTLPAASIQDALSYDKVIGSDGQLNEIKNVIVTCTAAGDTDIVALVLHKRICILRMIAQCASAGTSTLTLKTGSGTALSPVLAFAASEQRVYGDGNRRVFEPTNPNEKLYATAGARNVEVQIDYIEIP